MKRFCAFFAIIVLCFSAGFAQQFTPPPNKNAALRYWMAFADLTDHSADQATVKLMEDVLNGSAPWDEQKLAQIVEEYREPILDVGRYRTAAVFRKGQRVTLPGTEPRPLELHVDDLLP